MNVRIYIRTIILILTFLAASRVPAQEEHTNTIRPIFRDPPDRWQLSPKQRAIVWDVAHDTRLPHADRIEIGGRRTAAILNYDINALRKLTLTRTLVWPMLRIAPNDTFGFLEIDFTRDQPPCGQKPLASDGLDRFEPVVRVDGKTVVPKVSQVRYENGLFTITSDLGHGLQLEQTFTPGVTDPGFFELWQINAQSADDNCRVEITPLTYSTQLPYHYIEKGVYHYGQPRPPDETRAGNYRISIDCDGASAQVTNGMTGPVCAAGIFYSAVDGNETLPKPGFAREIANRAAFAKARYAELRFECPDPVLETAFDFAKIRSSDSICATKDGPMHAPGGGAYYAAIWANDTIEYVAPFYPFLGYDYANEATLNAMSQWERYLNPDYNPLPSSIIAEGTDIWSRRYKPDGLPDAYGDRGDAAMLAYGCSRFLLANGDRATALKHWPLIEWSLEYCNRHKTVDGVIASATDELEGRFPRAANAISTAAR